MIEIHILRDKSGRAVGTHSLGYTNYGDGTIDTVCTAVPVLELNFMNPVEELTDAKFEVHLDEEGGSSDFRLLGKRNRKTELLLQSLLLGYQTVQETYGNSYLIIKDQEMQ